MLTSAYLAQIDKRIDNIVKKRLNLFETRIIKKLNIIISLFENEFSSLKNRVNIIEKHVGLN